MHLVPGNVGAGQVLRILHLVREDEERVFDVAEARWGRLALRGVADGRHGRGVFFPKLLVGSFFQRVYVHAKLI